jgi:hypothetical protein
MVVAHTCKDCSCVLFYLNTLVPNSGPVAHNRFDAAHVIIIVLPDQAITSTSLALRRIEAENAHFTTKASCFVQSLHAAAASR